MTQIKISNLLPNPPGTGSGVCKGTDLIPATDTTNTTQAASGSTFKYTRSAELNFTLTAMGLTTYTACLTASTVALTVTYANGTAGVGATLTNAGAQAALTIDGVALAVGNRVLVKDQASTFQNGIYAVTNIGSASTNWVLTRATDYDEAAEIEQYGVMLINQGTVNAGLLYQETAAGPFTIGTSPITFTQFSTGSVTLPVSLANGGTGASLTASNGGIFYSDASTGEILAGTATATQMLQSGASTAPAWSSSTWPATTITNQLLYSSTTNTVVGLATAASAGLLTNGAGVPAWVAATGTGAPVLATSPVLVTPLLGTPTSGVLTNCTGLPVSTGISGLGTGVATALAVNVGSAGAFVVNGGALGTPSSGTLTNCTGLPIAGTTGYGTGVATALAANVTGSGGIVLATAPTLTQVTFSTTSGIIGTTTNDNAAALSVGQLVESNVASGSAVSATSTAPIRVTLISLTAGDWDVWANVGSLVDVTTTTSQLAGAISLVDNTLPTSPNGGGYFLLDGLSVAAGKNLLLPVGMMRITVAAPTDVYLVGQATFATSTLGLYGYIGARRRR